MYKQEQDTIVCLSNSKVPDNSKVDEICPFCLSQVTKLNLQLLPARTYSVV